MRVGKKDGLDLFIKFFFLNIQDSAWIVVTFLKEFCVEPYDKNLINYVFDFMPWYFKHNS
jgi:hypothetical protein